MEPIKYKKIVTVEAIQFNGKNSADIHEFCGDVVQEPVIGECMELHYPEYFQTVEPGDYVIKGEDGRFYVCTPEDFEGFVSDMSQTD